MQIVKPSSREILLARTFGAPPGAVFRALTRADQITQWMKSATMTLEDCEVELRVGGSFRYRFASARERKLEVRGTYHSVEPPKGYQYTESYDFSPLEVLVTTTLEPLEEHTTFRQLLLYRSKEERDADFDAVAESAESAYQFLDQYLRSLATPR